MSNFNESNTIQDMLFDAAGLNGWTLMDREFLDESANQGLPLQANLLKQSLLLLNKEKGLTPAQADEIVRQIQGVYLGLVNPVDLVETNKRLRERLFTFNSFPCGPDNLPTAIDFFDMNNARNNSCIAVREWTYRQRGQTNAGAKRFDIAFFINGFPMVMCETKTPVRPAISWGDAASDILDYEKSVPHVFVSNVFNIATEGKKLRYGGISAPLDKWGPWFADCMRREGTLDDVKHSFLSLVTPGVILDIYRNFSQPKHISCIAAPTEHIQARYVSSWLRDQRRYQDGRRTAIVLCDESLLPTVIHCLPDEVQKVNVTTGYPLSQTPVASFVQLYFNMLLGGRSPRLVRTFLRHPYARFLEVSGERLEVSALPAANGDLIGQLLTFLRQIATRAKDEIQDPLFQESLFRGYTLVNRLDGLIRSGDLVVTNTTLQRLLQQLIQQTTIPFHGEPAEGLQVMGVLETRNLDFDHVLLLSCNEGNMPRGVNDSSFIPHSIRKAYELTTIENKVGIYAYYFHRLLQRASDVTILWNNSTEDGQRGELSRFVLQLMVESPHDILRHSLQAGRNVLRWTPEPIAKTPAMLQVLLPAPEPGQPAPLLSPTAINRYLRCPLQFYYHYVGGIQEPDPADDEQELDNRIFGNIFHQAADTVYHQLPSYVTRDVLQQVLRDKSIIQRAVDAAFRQEMPHAPASGLHIINREVIIRYLRQLIEIDLRLAPFTILGLETDVFRELHVDTLPDHIPAIRIGGRIDRLDQLGDGRIRVVDYKTGSRQNKPLPDVESIFDPARIHDHADYYLQTFVYADIVRRQRNDAVSPALLYIQHASKDDYDPTLCFGKERIVDVADYRDTFCRLLEEKITEIFSTDEPFRPTDDLKTCRSCPYLGMCRR